jgi:preprotein translocase subunit SecG
LFILRQIREATSPDIDHANLLPAPPSLQAEVGQDPVPDLHAVRNRIGIGPAIGLERSVFDGIVQRRIPEHFGILFWAVIVAVALVWNGVIIISRWRDSFLTSIGSQITQVSSTDAWYSQLDRFGVLLTWEAAFVILIVGFVFLRSQRESRRFKIRPSRR